MAPRPKSRLARQQTDFFMGINPQMAGPTHSKHHANNDRGRASAGGSAPNKRNTTIKNSRNIHGGGNSAPFSGMRSSFLAEFSGSDAESIDVSVSHSSSASLSSSVHSSRDENEENGGGQQLWPLSLPPPAVADDLGWGSLPNVGQRLGTAIMKDTPPPDASTAAALVGAFAASPPSSNVAWEGLSSPHGSRDADSTAAAASPTDALSATFGSRRRVRFIDASNGGGAATVGGGKAKADGDSAPPEKALETSSPSDNLATIRDGGGDGKNKNAAIDESHDPKTTNQASPTEQQQPPQQQPRGREWRLEQRRKNALLQLGAQRAVERQTDFLSSVSPQMLQRHHNQTIRHIVAVDKSERKEERRRKRSTSAAAVTVLNKAGSDAEIGSTHEEVSDGMRMERNVTVSSEGFDSPIFSDVDPAAANAAEYDSYERMYLSSSTSSGTSTANSEQAAGESSSSSAQSAASRESTRKLRRRKKREEVAKKKEMERQMKRREAEREKRLRLREKEAALSVRFQWYSRQQSDYSDRPRIDRAARTQQRKQTKADARREKAEERQRRLTEGGGVGGDSAVLLSSSSGSDVSISDYSNSSAFSGNTLASLPTVASSAARRRSAAGAGGGTSDNDQQDKHSDEAGSDCEKRVTNNNNASGGGGGVHYNIDFRLREGTCASTAFYHEGNDASWSQFRNQQKQLRRRQRRIASSALSSSSSEDGFNNGDSYSGTDSSTKERKRQQRKEGDPSSTLPPPTAGFQTQPMAISSILTLYGARRRGGGGASEARDDLIEGHSTDSDDPNSAYSRRRRKEQQQRRREERRLAKKERGEGGGDGSSDSFSGKDDDSDDDDDDYSSSASSGEGSRRGARNGKGSQWWRKVASKGIKVVAGAAEGVIGFVGGHYKTGDEDGPSSSSFWGLGKRLGGGRSRASGANGGKNNNGAGTAKGYVSGKSKSGGTAAATGGGGDNGGDDDDEDGTGAGSLEAGKMFGHLLARPAATSIGRTLQSYSNAFFIDHPDAAGDRRRHLINAPSYRISVIAFAEEDVVRRELNEEFALRHPSLEAKRLKLTHIRRIKRELLQVAVGDPQSPIDLSTIAHAVWYFERLVEARRVTKSNRKAVATACLLLAIKFWETGLAIKSRNDIREKIKYGTAQMEKRLGVCATKVRDAEFRVYAALDFSLLATSPAVKRHILRLLDEMHTTPAEYYGAGAAGAK